MRKKIFLSILISMIFIAISSQVSAVGYGDADLQIPTLDSIKEEVESAVSPQAEFNGVQYVNAFGLDYSFRYGWNNGNYLKRYNFNEGMPTSMPNNPYPFDKKASSNPEVMFCITFADTATSTAKSHAIAYTGGYCVGWGVTFGEYDEYNVFESINMKEFAYTELKKNRDGDHLDEAGMKVVKYVLTYAYNYPIVEASIVNNAIGSDRTTALNGMHYFGTEIVKDDIPKIMATQYLCWIGVNGYLAEDKAAELSVIEDYFFERSWSGGNGNVVTYGVEDAYKGYISKIKAAMKMPTYSRSTEQEAKDNVYELKWSNDNQRYEIKISDDNNMSNVEKVKISFSGYNSSLHIEQQSDGSIVLWTKSVIGSKENPNVFDVVKTIEGAKDVAVVAKSSDKDHQPIAIPKSGTIQENAKIAIYTQYIRIGGEKELTPVKSCYGDATTEGCEYAIYEDEDCTQLVQTLKVDKNGKMEKSKALPFKKYYAVEVKNNDSTYLDKTVYVIDPTEAVSDEDGDLTYTLHVKDDIVTTNLEIIKYYDNTESTEKNPAAGAVLRLTLISNEKETYTANVDSEGFASFTNIPYGKYILSEDTSNSNVHLEIEDKEFELYVSNKIKTYRATIVDDKSFKAYVKVLKIDEDTGKEIKLAGAKFKIYDVNKKEWVSLMSYPSGEYINEFETNEDGYFITPGELVGGEYVLYETQAPKGYYLHPEYTIPQNADDLGDVTKGGIELNLTKIIEVEEISENEVVYTKEVVEKPLKGKIEVIKTGDMLAGYTTKLKTVNGENYDVTIPTYEEKGLEGVEYTLTVKEDIKSPDGTQTYVKKGTTYTIETDENGYAISDELYLGTYEITETKTPEGYVTDKNIPDITLENEDQTERIKTTTKELNNKKQTINISATKVLESVKYKVSDEKIKVVLGLYTNQDFKNYNNTEVMSKDTLVDVLYGEIDPGDSQKLKSEVDLPAGKYYIKELYVDYPYVTKEDKVEVEAKYGDTSEEMIEVESQEIVNEPDTVGKLAIVKLSTSTLYDPTDDSIVGGLLSEEEIAERSAVITEWMMKTPIEEVKAVLSGEKEATDPDIAKYRFGKDYMLSEAEYTVYADKECTKPLIDVETGEAVTIKTDSTGFGEKLNVPLGEYYLKETVAPKFIYQNKEIEYNLAPNPVQVILYQDDKDAIVCRALWDDVPIGKVITKTDIFTGEVVPNCQFKIEDKDGNIIVNAVTDENGEFKMKLDWFKEGETYYYTEISAPEIYNIDTTPHEFTVEFDEYGNIVKTEAHNTRKTSTVELTKLDIIDSTPIPNCKFELRSLETDYVVEGVTDENGVYVFKDIPYGKYTYTELEAPEEYLIDTTPHEITIDAEDIKIVVKDERAPETGDIAVAALAVVAVVCALGIVFVIAKNKKLSKNN
jgi:hypothetical protein